MMLGVREKCFSVYQMYPRSVLLVVHSFFSMVEGRWIFPGEFSMAMDLYTVGSIYFEFKVFYTILLFRKRTSGDASSQMPAVSASSDAL
jgi:hypothetical protein